MLFQIAAFFFTALAMASPGERQFLFQSSDTLKLRIIAPFYNNDAFQPESSEDGCAWHELVALAKVSQEQQERLVKQFKQVAQAAVVRLKSDTVLSEREKHKTALYYEAFRSALDGFVQKARTMKCEHK